jgi:hypothetical protein
MIVRAWLFGLFGAAFASAVAAETLKWDQAENIREAATHIGTLQKTRGAQKAIQFIDACYRTHGLASEYSRPFEACIAQDYLLTQSLASVYSRVSPEDLAKLGAPQPKALADAMGRRVVAAFKQYNISVADADAFKQLVDQHGFPVFIAIVFPNAEKAARPDDDGHKNRKKK